MSAQSESVDRYAVVGNPISHSLSPQIHRLFAEQTQQSMSYEAIELAIDDFPAQIRQLQQQGLKGANVTIPFKQQAWEICQQRSPRAEIAGAVNTLVFGQDGKVSGDNTDGAGLVRDLIYNHQTLIKHSKILILGAGGAARGVLAPLFEQQPESITIANRTLEKAEKLALDFNSIGQVYSSGYDDLGTEKFDLIINATAAGLSNQVPPIPDQLTDSCSLCYDMMYNLNGLTAFVSWGQNKGITKSIDGLGMLVEQAAEAFYIWRGVKVNTAEILKHFGR